MKRALIVGINTQDGAYLARLLLTRGYGVTGTSPDDSGGGRGLALLGIEADVTLRALAVTEASAVAAVLAEADADEVYSLAEPAGPGRGFDDPVAILQETVIGTQVLLDAVRHASRRPRAYFGGSGEVFGDTDAADEATAQRPRSPYGAAHAAARSLVAAYRDAYGLFAVTGIAFDRGSRLEPGTAVAARIVTAAQAIAAGNADALALADLDTVRDWGWTPEYVDAMWRMLQADAPNDCVIATGQAMTLRAFAGHALDYFGVDPERHLRALPAQPGELHANRGDPRRAAAALGWRAHTFGRDLVRTLCEGYAP